MTTQANPKPDRQELLDARETAWAAYEAARDAAVVGGWTEELAAASAEAAGAYYRLRNAAEAEAAKLPIDKGEVQP